jgi:shikimate kinase
MLHKLKEGITKALAGADVLTPAVVLIGPSGAGKTSVGAAIAQRHAAKHVDMDNIIESSSGLSIPDIFTACGETGFRELENYLLDTCIGTTSNNGHAVHTVISTGGGTPVFPGNLKKLNELGTVIALSASVETLLKRLGSKNNRPLLGSEFPDREEKRQALESLLDARKEIYQQAAITIDTTNLSITEVVALIEQKLCK